MVTVNEIRQKPTLFDPCFFCDEEEICVLEPKKCDFHAQIIQKIVVVEKTDP